MRPAPCRALRRRGRCVLLAPAAGARGRPSAPGACSSRSSATRRAQAAVRARARRRQARRRADPADRRRLGQPVGGRALADRRARAAQRPGVAHVEVERRHTLRFVPNDPSLTTPETAPRHAAGHAAAVVGRAHRPAGRVGPRARRRRDRRRHRHRHRRRRIPSSRGKIAEAIDNDSTPGTRRRDRRRERPRHPRRLDGLRRAATTARGSSAPGLNCRLIVIKTDLTDGSIARSIVAGRRPRRGRDQHELRHRRQHARPPARSSTRSTTPSARTSCSSPPPPTRPTEEQGDPANLLQPTGTGPDITAGRGLSVTAATSSTSARRSPAAARRSRSPPTARSTSGRRPARAARRVPGNVTRARARRRAGFRRSRRAAAARSSPATTATPTCRARRWPRRSSRRSPRSCAR